MASLSLKGIYKKYAGGVTAVSDFNLEIEDKEFIILVGPSGCGKSTTLRMIAGLEEISEGELYIGDRLVNDVAPKDRDIAMVFQNYALYPHMTVFDNMAFGLKLRKTPKDEIKKRVEEAARILDITHLLDRKPKALSGGQRQRVALGRAIVREPQVFLLDGGDHDAEEHDEHCGFDEHFYQDLSFGFSRENSGTQKSRPPLFEQRTGYKDLVVPPLFAPASRRGASSGTDIPYRFNGRTRRSLLGRAFQCAAHGMYSPELSPLPCTDRQLSEGTGFDYFFPVTAFSGS